MDEKGYQPSGISKAADMYSAKTSFPNTAYDAFKAGYQQAEKDLALTWEDVKRIVEIADSLMPYVCVKQGDLEHNFQSEEAYYKEVLKRYRDGK